MMSSSLGLWARWAVFRNALLTRSDFQRWAARFPLTRPIAMRRASRLFDLCAGFVYAQVLLACVELKLFEVLAESPQDAGALAARLGLRDDAMRRLLDAAAPLALVEAHDGFYHLGPDGAAYLGNPGLGAMIKHHAMFYRDLADPVALLKADKADTELARFWPYAGAERPGSLDDASTKAYSELMAASQEAIAADILESYPFRDHRRLLDIGGGHGVFASAAGHRHPEMSVVLLDLPTVAARAAERFETERFGQRARAVGGDFKRDPLPEGADLVSLIRVAHDLADADLTALLARICAALPPGGILLLAEPMAGTPGAERLQTYFELYLLAMRRGRPRAATELKSALYAAGFARVRCVATPRPLLTGLLIAQKSAGPRNRAVRSN